MNVKQLVSKCDSLKKRLEVLFFLEASHDRPFPMEAAVAYNGIIDQLLHIKPVPTIMQIVVQKVVPQHEDDQLYFSVSGYDPEDTLEHGMLWGLEYVDWAEWLSMEIKEDAGLPPEEVLAHILWEMTWNGFTRERITEKRDELNAMMDDPGEYIPIEL